MSSKLERPVPPADVVLKVASLSDELLFEELRCLITKGKNGMPYDRNMAVAVGDECRKRGWDMRTPSID